jgi:pentatricopeptide repeat protein
MIVSLAILAATLIAQEPLVGTSTEAHRFRLPEEKTGQDGMPVIDTSCGGAEEFGGSELERAAFCLFETGGRGRSNMVSVRSLADRALRENPGSFRAQFLVGAAHHQGEGNLPKALYHLEQSEQLLIDNYGEQPSVTSPIWKVFYKVMMELVYVHGEMDHHVEKILYVDLIKDRIGVDVSPLKAWPLLKLKRFDEARQISESAANSTDPFFRAVGLTALCAVESEQRRRMEAYRACMAAAEIAQENPLDGAVELSNAAAAASEVFKLDEAERMYLQAADREIDGSVNPWGRLVRLYLRQGRFSEALGAWRKMRDYRKQRPDYLLQQDESDADLIGAAVLMIAGRSRDAAEITERTVHRPDRQGTSSAQAEQNEAGAALTDRVVKLDVARQLEEEASVAEFWDSLKLRAEAVRLRYEAWVVGRRAAEVLADRERLVSSLRPECPGSIELPEWLDAEIIHVVGPGVALAAIREARFEETLPPELSELIFRSFEAEAYLLRGDEAAALENASWVVEHLPPSEALLRARAAAIAAQAAVETGDYEQAMQMYTVVLSTDPGVIRRLGFTLPVVLEAGEDTPEVAEALELLSGSPLFEQDGWGFRLVVRAQSASLMLEDGTELFTVRIPAARSGDAEGVSRRIARAVHRELLVPEVDVTQADIRSLDGALGSGGRASERAKSILEEVLEDSK